jgi:chloride channel protein, CIC family
VLAAEILYKDDLETEALIPGLVASIIGYTIFGAWAGWTPIFGEQATLRFDEPVRLLYYAVMGVACGLVGILYARSFYGIGGLFKRWRFPVILKPAIGGLLVGLIGLVIPPVLGTGYGWVQVGMDQRLLGLPLWLVLVIPFAKILATSLSIGSGGSGGIFGPGMVIGGLLGASLWRLAYAAHLPGLPPTAAPFVIIAMMALFGGIAHAPLAVMLMVAEMSGNLSLLAPAMVAVGISSWIVGHNTIYESQLPSRADSPAHRLEMAFPLLATLTAADAMQPVAVALAPNSSLAAASPVLDGLKTRGTVVAEDGELLGVLSRGDVDRVPPQAQASTPASDVMTRDPVTVAQGESLESALSRLIDRRVSWLPVVNVPDGTRLVGILPIEAVVRTYRSHVSTGVRQMKGVVQETLASSGGNGNR